MKKTTTFYCFSPPVMIATMVLETAVFLYVLFRYKLNFITRLIAAILLLLAVFQLSEFNVCQDNLSEAFMRLGFVAITLLPPLVLHLILKIADKKFLPLLVISYAVAAGFALVFGLQDTALLNHVCGGNYAIFTLADKFGGYYFAYYYALLFIGLGLALYFAHTSDKRARKALLLQVLGYMSFLLPTGIVNTVNPVTLNAIPSIMCGFAVIYALILGFGIAPLVAPRKNTE